MSDVEMMLQDIMQHARDGGEFIVFDNETTGFSAAKDRILSISAIKAKYDVETNCFVEIDRMDQYMNPERRIPPEVTKLTHINYDRIKNEPTEDEVAYKIAAFFGTNPFIIGQNVDFDIRFLAAMANRCGFIFAPSNVADTLKLAKKMIGPRSENHKLETLIKFFNIKRDDLSFHESISDVIATMRVMEKFLLLYQDKVDIEEFAKQYNERKDADEFIPVSESDVPFKSESKKDLYKPAITSISYWEAYGMKRIYANSREYGLKLWYDIVKDEYGTKCTAGSYGEIDMEFVKETINDLLHKPENAEILSKLKEGKQYEEENCCH